MEKKEDKWRKPRSVKGTLEKIRFGDVDHKASTRLVRRASSSEADRVRTAEGGLIVHIPASKSQLKIGASGREDSRLRSRRSKRISFVNNGWRELKETPSRNWKTLCQAIMFGVSEKRP
ncbi:hypothetical protein T12_854 [Trichinella patagoniensis]|uniref:Uncharacterized protein n=1 Tax=Trichinella patagoniensis TaxID=990121 RepID=A0A0V0Z477_9BILA|nr:hypothetical protein T12_854 [Trichinella patagoniensis]